MELEIERLDHHGRGIAHVNGKIIFVDNALPGEKVRVEIIKSSAKYDEAVVTEYITESPDRVKSKCPFYLKCGGCHLRHMSYEDTLKFKENKIREILKKYAGIEPDIKIIKNANKDFYRNKIEVKIVNGVAGFYKKRSHELVEVDRCINAEETINAFLMNTNLLHLENAEVTIKANYSGEIIIVINSQDEVNVDIEGIKGKHKLVGIIYNGKTIYGADHFIETVDNILFKESYNSFFQVNRYINEELFKLIRENINEDDTVIDLCSGVGTLSIVASAKAKKVYGIEIIENAVKDSLINARMNKKDNVEFICGDAFKEIANIDDKINTIIVDPPRSGLNKDALVSILKMLPAKLLYISCDPITLSRDLKVLLSKYEINKFYILDMFSYTYHLECVSLLSLKEN